MMLEGSDIKIIELRHNKPYSILGLHYSKQEQTYTIRAFLPQAEHVYVLRAGGRKQQMQRIHPDGLFALQIDSDTPPQYQLMVVEPEGHSFTFHDPYAICEPSFTPDDSQAFQQGTLKNISTRLGAHPQVKRGIAGINFALWAPHASRISVVGTFNQWDGRRHPMEYYESGIWELFIPHITAGELYKFEIRDAAGTVFLKTDPLAFNTEIYPRTAAIICDLDKTYSWHDSDWMTQITSNPVWELQTTLHRVTLNEHAGEQPDQANSYPQLQTKVVPWLVEHGFQHVELSFWEAGETVASYFAPNPRYGTPEEFMALIDACHQHHIDVILNWLPPQIPAEGQELSWFDGTQLYTADAPDHPAMQVFNLEHPEVRNIVLDNALFWQRVYHIDALCSDPHTFTAYLQNTDAIAGLRFLLREVKPEPTLDIIESTSLIKGKCTNPQALLGLHPYNSDTNLSVVRALLPDVDSAWLRCDQHPQWLYSLQALYAGGVFETRIVTDSKSLHYQISATTQGQSRTFIDPYAIHFSILGDQDGYLFAEGNHYQIYQKLGAHPCRAAGINGTNFAVWAPNALRVSVVGSFNHWDSRCHPMHLRAHSGIWELFIPDLDEGELYKFEILSPDGTSFLKTDPFAFHTEIPPGTASVVYDRAGKHTWRDHDWMQQRSRMNPWERPVAIYEVHAGSWRRKPDGRFLSYREMADQLIPYVLKMGFTHIEFLPLAEHPYSPSWGYQISNFYAPTARFGKPEDLMELIDRCHQNGIGVILDWVPAHFPKDAYAMSRYDGTHLFEHADPRQGEHPDWGTLIFNYGRHEVENFLIANALYWLDTFHFDGLRVDAVAAMLYLDYSKEDWIPNKYGGNENLEAIEFIKHTNAIVHARFPGVMMIAEESTAWPKVSHPTDIGGLGFGFKWNMGWMHDVLAYMQQEPAHRRYHHEKLIFSLAYAFDENFILSLSHDEVVHLKKSLLGKMPGTRQQQLANLRLLYTFMYSHPGKKLLFMGSEFGQPGEWDHDTELPWALTQELEHKRLQHFVADLNHLYRREPTFYQVDFRDAGFEWLDANGAETNVIAFIRKGRDPRDAMLCILNFSDVPRLHYRIGVPYPVDYRKILNTDDSEYGGSGGTSASHCVAVQMAASHHFAFSIVLDLPPLSAVLLKPEPLVLESTTPP